MGVRKRMSRWMRRKLANWRFVRAHRGLRGTPKILHAITPAHSNLGDHAMALAI